MNKLKLNNCITCHEKHYIYSKSGQCLKCHAKKYYKNRTAEIINNNLFPNYKYEYTNKPEAIQYQNSKHSHDVFKLRGKNEISFQLKPSSQIDTTIKDKLSETLSKITIERALENK